MFTAGYKYQNLWHLAGYHQRMTAVLVKDHIQADIQATMNSVNDCQAEIKRANNSLKKYAPIIIDVLVDNLPAKKYMKDFREGLQVLVDLWK